MAKGMGLTVVAEGVDNTERLSLLKSTQCDIYQGFHFSKAVSSDQIRSQLEERIHEKNTIKSAERCSRGQWQCLAAEVN
jgi:EAL domain-containing protein (putative c-di-GMP-specific phosphodiesterase class I)